MLIKTHLSQQFNIEAITKQVLNLPWATEHESQWSYAVNSAPDDTNGMFHSGASMNINDPYILNPEFENTPIGDAISALGPIGGAHLRKLQKGWLYGAHTDVDNRLHMAVTTNPFAVLLDFETNTIHKIPVDGKWYFMDTSIPHDGVNFANEDRIHLHVSCLVPPGVGKGALLDILPIADPTQETYQPWFEQLFLGFINKSIVSGAINGYTQTGMRSYQFAFDDSTAFDTICNHITGQGYGISVVAI